MIKDVVAAVVSHTPEDGETGHQDGVIVVPQSSVLHQSNQSLQASEGGEVTADRGVRAKPAIMRD